MDFGWGFVDDFMFLSASEKEIQIWKIAKNGFGINSSKPKRQSVFIF